ncbi:hypothetical protein QAD02_016720 [Eretmocerus hayati]|uniref:Uncharacterized protein n=1 Tax=Eretmocerus hayati TaxID=131215 RepID=A0ACC2PBW0_9HYME|nr:hypothetical protein QAD02_016720 [Eretmocerus hayati]
MVERNNGEGDRLAARPNRRDRRFFAWRRDTLQRELDRRGINYRLTLRRVVYGTDAEILARVAREVAAPGYRVAPPPPPRAVQQLQNIPLPRPPPAGAFNPAQLALQRVDPRILARHNREQQAREERSVHLALDQNQYAAASSTVPLQQQRPPQAPQIVPCLPQHPCSSLPPAQFITQQSPTVRQSSPATSNIAQDPSPPSSSLSTPSPTIEFISTPSPPSPPVRTPSPRVTQQDRKAISIIEYRKRPTCREALEIQPPSKRSFTKLKAPPAKTPRSLPDRAKAPATITSNKASQPEPALATSLNSSKAPSVSIKSRKVLPKKQAPAASPSQTQVEGKLEQSTKTSRKARASAPSSAISESDSRVAQAPVASPAEPKGRKYLVPSFSTPESDPQPSTSRVEIPEITAEESDTKKGAGRKKRTSRTSGDISSKSADSNSSSSSEDESTLAVEIPPPKQDTETPLDPFLPD